MRPPGHGGAPSFLRLWSVPSDTQLAPPLGGARQAAPQSRVRARAAPGVWCRFAQGATQIGDDQARSWMVVGKSGRGSTPARIASHVDQRHDGFSSTRT